MFGGVLGGVNRVANDTWEWDGLNWRQVAPPVVPVGRKFHAVTYDSRRERVVVYGGQSDGFGVYVDTWEYGPTTFLFSDPSACSSPLPLPAIAPVGNSRPWLGATFTISISTAPATPAVAILGTTNPNIPLDALRMTQCRLGADVALTLPFAPTVALPVPNDPALAGGAIRIQGLAVIPASNPLGVVLSNTLDATLTIR